MSGRRSTAGVLAAAAPLGMPSGKVAHHPGWKPLQGDLRATMSQELRNAPHILPAHWTAPHTGFPRTHLAPHTFSGAREGVLVAVTAVKTRRRLARTSERVRGAGTGLEPSLGHDRSRIPAMASSQGDVRSSPMAYPAVRPLPAKTPATSTARHGP